MVTLVNRAKVSTSTTGTGTITLGAAADGYQTFAAAGVTDGQTVRYVIEDGSNFEIGTGVFGSAGGTLTRTVSESSNADAAINLSGTAVVFVGATAEDLAPIRKPTVISPNGATDVVPDPTLTASAYAPLYSVDARSVREFQLTTFADTGYATPVFTASVNADTVAVTPDLDIVTQYRWRCRDVAVSGATSAYSTDAVFTTLNIIVNAPTLTVEGSPTEVPKSPILTTGAFATTPAGQDTHASTNWIVRLASNDSIVYQSLANTVNKLTIEVPDGILLADNTQYKFQAQHIGTTYGASAVTEVVADTVDSFGPTVIGQAFGGGFYAGNIVQGGAEYFIIVSPRASGQTQYPQFKTSNTASPVQTQTLNNGPAATAAMVAAGSHPAAAFCAGLNIGGFSDWYLPARDELELLYRNLKPTTQVNTTVTRDGSGITYPEGNDQSGDTMGRNRNSNPLGAGYTAGSPAQTSITAFKTGGTEFLSTGNTWCSTESGALFAWSMQTENGGQNANGFKTGGRLVRAVRRIPV